ncbi:MAG: tRNA (adenosine(37)-N6)-threonylcarbamoyltransferase complex dimerization subunit type 1 TsaB [Pseudomonadales bacterium]|nr:tRNA (adenosine(37)-N6)-threonylcarbamoyltransferase complex dimerization subunit type 1 TsaB [Pseudomonadales bacterium]
MRTLLAIETSARFSSVAISLRGEVYETVLEQKRNHAELILPAVRQLLCNNKAGLHEVNQLLFNTGPGSFTGLRIGAGVIQGLAFSADIPVVAVSGFEVYLYTWLKMASIPDEPSTRICVVIDAHLGDVYTQDFFFNENGVYHKDNRRIMKLSAFVESQKLQAGKVVYIGDEQLQQYFDELGLMFHSVCPVASSMMTLLQNDKNTNTLREIKAAEVVPFYMRENIGWKKWRPKSVENTLAK